MVTFLAAFLVSLMVGVALTAAVRNRALAYGWLDQAKSSRKIHDRPIPRLGGVAIVGGFFAPLCALWVIDSGVGLTFFANKDLVWGLFVGGLSIAGLGLYDDLRGAGAPLKFAVQFAVAMLLYQRGFRIEVIANPFGDPIALGTFALPFTLVWMVGVMNAMNLIDGLDGLAGGVAFFGVATNFALSVARGDVLMCLLMAALGGAVLGFLIFNFNPASIFMGDAGSMFLGFVLATVSIKTSTKSGTAVAMLVPIISLGLPIMDTLLAMLRRSALGRPLFSADKEHIHHRIMSRLFLSHRRAVLLLYGLCCLFTLTALGLSYANSAESAMLLLGLGVVVVVLMRQLGYLSLGRAPMVAADRKRSLQLREVMRETCAHIGQAQTFPAVWEALRPLAEAVGASRLELNIRVERDGSAECLTFESQRGSPSGVPLDFSAELSSRGQNLGRLLLRWTDGRSELKREEELALELTADAVANAAADISSSRAPVPANVVALRP